MHSPSPFPFSIPRGPCGKPVSIMPKWPLSRTSDKRNSVTGNRTPVSRVTGGDTSHYTMTDLLIGCMRPKLIAPHPLMTSSGQINKHIPKNTPFTHQTFLNIPYITSRNRATYITQTQTQDDDNLQTTHIQHHTFIYQYQLHQQTTTQSEKTSYLEQKYASICIINQ